MVETTNRTAPPAPNRAEQLSHALYGLIIVTATLVAEKEHISEAAEAIALLLGTAVVLVLAHTYSAIMAERAIEGSLLGTLGRRMVVKDNLPVLLAIAVPVPLFMLAWLDAISMQVAYTVSITFSLVALFGLGLYEGRSALMSWPRSILSGAMAGVIGMLVVALEAVL